MQLATIAFSTDKFPPILPEPCQVNADLYGFELAVWLVQALAEREMVTSYPHAEEFGWFLEYLSEEGQELMIGCASVGASQGYPTDWTIFLRQRRKPPRGAPDMAPQLAEAILSALAAEGIEAKRTA